jgi:hypothetical protein
MLEVSPSGPPARCSLQATAPPAEVSSAAIRGGCRGGAEDEAACHSRKTVMTVSYFLPVSSPHSLREERLF